jgi:hypothetical protein
MQISSSTTSVAPTTTTLPGSRSSNHRATTNHDCGVHCKVSFNGQFRRFQFPSSSYEGMHGYVAEMLKLDTNNNRQRFELKYQDNEQDLVTISSDEELAAAISLTPPGQTLRLSVCEVPVAFPTAPSSSTSTTSTVPSHDDGESPLSCSTGHHHRHGGGHGKYHRPQHLSAGHHHPYHHPHHHKHNGDHHHGKFENDETVPWFEFKKEKLSTKLATLESLLSSDPQQEDVEYLERKIEKVRSALVKLEKCHEKKEKRSKKEKGEGKKKQHPSEISSLWSLIKAKKTALRQAQLEDNKELVQQLSVELESLKLAKKEQKRRNKEQ